MHCYTDGSNPIDYMLLTNTPSRVFLPSLRRVRHTRTHTHARTGNKGDSPDSDVLSNKGAYYAALSGGNDDDEEQQIAPRTPVWARTPTFSHSKYIPTSHPETTICVRRFTTPLEKVITASRAKRIATVEEIF